MLDIVVRFLKFSQTNFLISLHKSTLEQCYYIKNLKNPNNDLKTLQNLHLKKQNIAIKKRVLYKSTLIENILKKHIFRSIFR